MSKLYVTNEDVVYKVESIMGVTPVKAISEQTYSFTLFFNSSHSLKYSDCYSTKKEAEKKRKELIKLLEES